MSQLAFWQKNTTYPAGSYILDGAGNIQYTATGGLSGNNPPTWTTGVTVDNTIHWVWQGVGGKITTLQKPSPTAPYSQATVDATSISRGSSDAGKIVLLNSSGQLDTSMGGGGGGGGGVSSLNALTGSVVLGSTDSSIAVTTPGGGVIDLQTTYKVVNVKNYGAVGSGVGDTASINASSHALHSDSGLFVPSDAGSIIVVAGAGIGGVDLWTTIASYGGPSDVTLTAAASTTVASVTTYWRLHDDTAGLQAAFNAVTTTNEILYIPSGIYYHTASVSLGATYPAKIVGDSFENTIFVSASGVSLTSSGWSTSIISDFAIYGTGNSFSGNTISNINQIAPATVDSTMLLTAGVGTGISIFSNGGHSTMDAHDMDIMIDCIADTLIVTSALQCTAYVSLQGDTGNDEAVSIINCTSSGSIVTTQGTVSGCWAASFTSGANTTLINCHNTTSNTWIGLQVYGTGAVNATEINGVSITGTPLSGNVPIASSGIAAAWGQLAYSQISGTPTLPQNTTAVSHEFFTAYNSSTGAFSLAQPAFTDISGTIATAQEPSTTVNSVVNDTNVTGSISAQALTLGWTGYLSVARGGTGTNTPSLVAGTGINITGTWPNQTVTNTGGGGAARGTYTHTTASLVNNAVETSTIVISLSFMVLKVVVSGYARVRLYSTAAAATADVSRPPTTPPAAGTQHEVIMDMQLDSTYGSTSFVMSPAAVGANMESTPSTSISINTTNLTGSTGTITVTITAVPLE
jgi:hypothetical protein